MKKLVLAIVVAACLASAASAQAAPVPGSTCKLIKVVYWTQVEKGQPYLYLQFNGWCWSGSIPRYDLVVDAPAPLTKWPYRQYSQAGVTSTQKFPVFYAKNKLGKLILAGAGVTVTFGSSQNDLRAGVRRSYYQTCAFSAKGSKGVITSPACWPAFEQDTVVPSGPTL